jgi:hypothetical protein
MGDITQKIRSSDKFWATNCSPSGTGSACTAKPMCCEENHWVSVVLALAFFQFSNAVHDQDGLIVIGCTNVNVDAPIEP